MKKYVFLDIDDVIVPHDFQSIDEIIKHSGYDNWEKVDHQYAKQINREMLNDISEFFGDYVYWLTTWELHRDGANALFSGQLGFRYFKEIPFIGDYYNLIPSGAWLSSDMQRNWWKSTMLDRFVDKIQADGEDYRIVWIDNEIEEQRANGSIHVALLADDKIKMISPYPCLKRNQILEARNWLMI